MTTKTQNPTSSPSPHGGKSTQALFVKAGYTTSIATESDEPLASCTATQLVFHILCKTAALATQTQGAQWSHMGSDFAKVRRLLQKQYMEMCNAVDRLGERLRALGQHIPFDVSEIRSRLHENGSFTLLPTTSSQVELIQTLVTNHSNLVNILTQAIDVWQTKQDQTTTHILLAQKDLHTKSLWMLRAAMAGSQGLLRRSFI